MRNCNMNGHAFGQGRYYNNNYNNNNPNNNNKRDLLNYYIYKGIDIFANVSSTSPTLSVLSSMPSCPAITDITSLLRDCHAIASRD